MMNRQEFDSGGESYLQFFYRFDRIGFQEADANEAVLKIEQVFGKLRIFHNAAVNWWNSVKAAYCAETEVGVVARDMILRILTEEMKETLVGLDHRLLENKVVVLAEYFLKSLESGEKVSVITRQDEDALWVLEGKDVLLMETVVRLPGIATDIPIDPPKLAKLGRATAYVLIREGAGVYMLYILYERLLPFVMEGINEELRVVSERIKMSLPNSRRLYGRFIGRYRRGSAEVTETSAVLVKLLRKQALERIVATLKRSSLLAHGLI